MELTKIPKQQPEQIPDMIYGTAWAYEKTTQVVEEALDAGFRGLDTACQRPQYRQDLVGRAISSVLKRGLVSRKDLWIQSKFTHCEDAPLKSLPYDFYLPLCEQVKSSVQATLDDLFPGDDLATEENYLDSLLLHAPLSTENSTLEVWRAMEGLVPGRVRALGMSNVPLPILKRIHDLAVIKPAFVQNRFIPDLGFDRAVQRYCQQKSIRYQAFCIIRGNPSLLASQVLKDAALSTAVSPEALLYHLVFRTYRAQVLNGSTDTTHIRKDMLDLRRLSSSVGNIANAEFWNELEERFRELTNDSRASSQQLNPARASATSAD